jgi:hypothetical protein
MCCMWWYNKPVIPATQKAETGRIMFQDQPRHKVSETSSEFKLQVHTCNPSHMGGVGKRIGG